MYRKLLPAFMAFIISVNALAQTVPSGFSDALVLGNWNAAVGATWDTNGRQYVWEKRGIVWIVDNGAKLPVPLIDLSEEVGNWRDHGLLGFALDPQFLVNGHIYLLYSVDRHHLMHHGTASYDPLANEYFAATIMRITRYTAIGPELTTVSPASRTVLLGETPDTGAPMLHESHSAGSLLFGTDGTLLATLGDGASYASTDIGSAPETYWAQALADSIIREEENVGSLRSQMVNSLNGKIIRIDPTTGDGIPSNPWYDAAEPRAPRSRVWGLGIRNAYRMTIKPNSGSTDPAAGQPGILFFGDVGWNLWEELNICTEGGMNFGWPLFEGMEPIASYMNAPVQNRDAVDPLYDGITCLDEFYDFQDLIVQATPVHLNAHPAPCNPLIQIPNSIPRHFHSRPAIDWQHGNRSRCGAFNGDLAVTFDLDDPDSPVSGPSFGGYAAMGGPWMQGASFPAEYQNSSFHADYVFGWIKRFVTDEQGHPVSVHDFASNLGNITWLGAGPDGCIWYIKYNSNELRKICYTLNVDLPPIAVATQDIQYGPSPLTLHFTGSGSSDPENSALTYLWDFGDGNTSTVADPVHVFTAPEGIPTTFTVTLTVTDAGGQQGITELIVSVNNTPPLVEITSFDDGSFYPVGIDTLYQLQANVTDAEHGPGQLTYAWRTTLHHNTHSHPEAEDDDPITTTIISGVGCDGETYSYNISLTVTDAAGLSTTVEHWLYPRCHAIAPIAVITASSTAGMAPLVVTLDGSSSNDPGEIVSYHWSLGDGTFSTEPSLSKTFTESGDHVVTLTVTDDDGLTGQATRIISVLLLDPPLCVGALGSIKREVWNNVPGNNVSQLTSHPDFTNSPSAISYPSSLQGPANAGDNFGARYRGYIIAPFTGNYTFTVTSDDASQVFLGYNSDPRHKRMICSVPGWTTPTQYTKYPSQISTTIHLEMGAYYYVEILHKEGAGDDHVALRWQTPANNTRTIIPGSALARWQDCPPSIRLRTNLNGPYDPEVDLMRDDLRSNGFLPTLEPYSALGLAHIGGGGESIPASRLNIMGKNAMVDWVVVELRDKTTPSVVIATRSAILEKDGDIVDVTGRSRLLFNVAPDEYHIAVRHRNHLGIMTAAPVALGAHETWLDHTRSTTATFGVNARKQMPNGTMALWAGDALRDGTLRYSGANNDRDVLLQQIGGIIPTATFSGYVASDLNMDGVVKYAGNGNDRDLILQNIGGIIPTAIRQQQLP